MSFFWVISPSHGLNEFVEWCCSEPTPFVSRENGGCLFTPN